jgi:hypothetical protein
VTGKIVRVYLGVFLDQIVAEQAVIGALDGPIASYPVQAALCCRSGLRNKQLRSRGWRFPGRFEGHVPCPVSG